MSIFLRSELVRDTIIAAITRRELAREHQNEANEALSPFSTRRICSRDAKRK